MTADRTNDARTAIRNLPTGVLGLDSVLGGGMPEYSFNLIAGAPGAGKTTLAQQIVFANATAERPALYFTVLGEPTLKMLRYQRQFRFFKPELIESAVRFVNLRGGRAGGPERRARANRSGGREGRTAHRRRGFVPNFGRTIPR